MYSTASSYQASLLPTNFLTMLTVLVCSILFAGIIGCAGGYSLSWKTLLMYTSLAFGIATFQTVIAALAFTKIASASNDSSTYLSASSTNQGNTINYFNCCITGNSTCTACSTSLSNYLNSQAVSLGSTLVSFAVVEYAACITTIIVLISLTRTTRKIQDQSPVSDIIPGHEN